eukprot:6189170-Pleurochrysis_carterae.AAC.3
MLASVQTNRRVRRQETAVHTNIQLLLTCDGKRHAAAAAASATVAMRRAGTALAMAPTAANAHIWTARRMTAQRISWEIKSRFMVTPFFSFCFALRRKIVQDLDRTDTLCMTGTNYAAAMYCRATTLRAVPAAPCRIARQWRSPRAAPAAQRCCSAYALRYWRCTYCTCP